MKITGVRTHVLGTPWRNLTIVEVLTDEGISGLGEVRMLNHTDALHAYLEEAAPRHIIGSDPFDVESLVHRMMRHDYARPGEIAMSALAIVEIACWDIKGKALGLPVYKLLGGPVRDRILAYANGWYQVERTPEEFHDAARKVVERGYRALKLDPFGAGMFELDAEETARSIALVEAVRAAVGPDVDILIEMHGRFNAATAIRIANLLEPYRPGWIEEPVPPENLKALAKVAAHTDIPIATGERLHTRYDWRELFELQAADILQTDITHSGGLLEGKKLAGAAETHYLLMAPHNVGGTISTAANLHLAATTVNFKIQEHFNDFADSFVKECAPGLPEVVDGYFALPDGPGLGVRLDHEALAAHPRVRVDFNLFADGWERRQALRS
ncbi:MAG TPA: mandelate racemase/muconate lactonizing enzyme family protein [Actinophytocola sp.]|uniref:mandelate racemase/muconate lactonizing enzyme family protein n=1 Tax=Actinophytocola sp. TaxID=1872138 RepID=UPI002DDCCEFB|nr:mandelate racemase/muconate lactonizing enzyme family protein [Actinophytocola sp.]HEV2784044.1 mandelate racemase/muconate lactonizing enzyme family protein [Actinophytocola sp.]